MGISDCGMRIVEGIEHGAEGKIIADCEFRIADCARPPRLKPRDPPATASSPACRAVRGGQGHERAGAGRARDGGRGLWFEARCQAGRLKE
jgi:hypothetical protein